MTQIINRTPQEQEQFLCEVAQRILSEAKKQGATAAEVGVNQDSGLSTTVRLSEVETMEFHTDRGLGITVYFDQRKGSASTSDVSDQSIRDTVTAACAIAKYTSEDECSGLAEADLMATYLPDLDLFHPWNLQPDEAIELARECEQAAREFDKKITNSEGATVNTHQGCRVYANSHGFVGGYLSSRHSISCVVLAEHDGDMQRDYWYSVARAQQDLENVKAIGLQAAQRTLARLNSRQIKTGEYPVIFSADTAGGLLRSFLSAISGGNLYRQSSFLLDSLNTSVFSPHIHIYEDPLIKKGLGSGAFDDDGVATHAKDLIKDGILQTYLLSAYSARKLKMKTTANAGGVHNLFINHGDQNLKQLLGAMGSGLLVTELMGQGVNMVTGDYSRGAAGFWIENGQVQYPVSEITVAGNLKNILKDIVMVGNDVDKRSHIQTGSLLINKMMVAGQ
jgi:PmbA protein